MFVNENEPEVVLLEPGVHKLKVVGHEVNDKGWTLTFGKGGFKTTAFGNSPYLREEGSPEEWMKRIGGWVVGTKVFFGKIMGSGEMNRVVKEVEAKIVAKYPTQKEQFASLEIVKSAVKLLITSLLAAADPYFKSTWFDVTLEAGVYLDAEGNEKQTLRVPKKSAENGYLEGYKVSKDQTDPVEEIKKDSTQSTEDVPNWVNEESQVTSRTEPTDLEW